jgi:hypothetical protein
MIVPTRSQTTYPYDPWEDLNDDGKIDLYDAVMLLNKYGTKGTPINKTALLLNLQQRVEALETRTPKKGYVSISPAAFTPQSNTQTYYKYSSYLRGQGSFNTGVQLPNGATLIKMTVLLIDGSNNGRVEVLLMGFNITERYPLTIPMASVATTDLGQPGEVLLYDDTIADAVVDNKNCEYALYAWFTRDDISLYIQSVVLEYEYPQ